MLFFFFQIGCLSEVKMLHAMYCMCNALQFMQYHTHHKLFIFLITYFYECQCVGNTKHMACNRTVSKTKLCSTQLEKPSIHLQQKQQPLDCLKFKQIRKPDIFFRCVVCVVFRWGGLKIVGIQELGRGSNLELHLQQKVRISWSFFFFYIFVFNVSLVTVPTLYMCKVTGALPFSSQIFPFPSKILPSGLSDVL